jgi:hypothetical protein
MEVEMARVWPEKFVLIVAIECLVIGFLLGVIFT